MPAAEGEIFRFSGEDEIRADYLETIEYNGAVQEIVYETGEFSAVCPFSGLPDIGHITVKYVPSKKLVELKSLKYYFVSYRNVGIYQEKATDRIFSDLRKLLEPERISVKTVYNVRGGIVSTCLIDSEKM